MPDNEKKVIVVKKKFGATQEELERLKKMDELVNKKK